MTDTGQALRRRVAVSAGRAVAVSTGADSAAEASPVQQVDGLRVGRSTFCANRRPLVSVPGPADAGTHNNAHGAPQVIEGGRVDKPPARHYSGRAARKYFDRARLVDEQPVSTDEAPERHEVVAEGVVIRALELHAAREADEVPRDVAEQHRLG